MVATGKQILFILPYARPGSVELDELNRTYRDIHFCALSSFTNLREELRALHAEGLAIVAARGITAQQVKRFGFDLSVVEIPLTVLDIYRKLRELPAGTKNIAVCTSQVEPIGFDMLKDLSPFSIRCYDSKTIADIPQTIQAAVADGAEYVFAGPEGCAAAGQLRIPSSIMYVGPESLEQTVRAIRQVQTAIEIEVTRNGFYRAVLDSSSEGIVTLDSNDVITSLNPVAARILPGGSDALIGQAISRVLPALCLQSEDIVTIKDCHYLLGRTPVVVGGKSFGAILTLQEISLIQKKEKEIRQKIYLKGHCARYRFSDMVGASPAMRTVIDKARVFADAEANILIHGDTGTGKELLAQSIHNGSPRSNEPFVAINCAALPANILESELFGYVGGAFTGARKEGKIGLFEMAHKGTIFLDEISEIDVANQGRLLRVIQEKTVMKLGSDMVTPVDIRIIAATNKNLPDLVDQGLFRNDLYYRLNVLTLDIPPLVQRKTDIAALARHFLAQFCGEQKQQKHLTRSAIATLENYHWPGNVRELQNAIERACIISRGADIGPEDFDNLAGPERDRGNAPQPETASFNPRDTGDKGLKTWETEALLAALEDAHGDRQKAARILGISRTTLWRKLKQLEKTGILS